jgi:signal transduction histidine kinase
VATIPDARASTVLILAPLGRDAEIARTGLWEADIRETQVSPDFASFENALSVNTLFCILTEEALVGADLSGIAIRLGAQPSWSDLPFIILTYRDGGPDRDAAAARLSGVLGNVTFLERPFHAATFISVAKTALKSRQRQYEARSRMEEMATLNATLETRVAERTAELERVQRKVLQEIMQRERAQDILRQTQKLELIGQLTGGVAHDFNNLLTAVLGNLELLRKHLPPDSKPSRLIEGALYGAQRGAALTQRLLAFARRQDLHVEPKNLGDLVKGVSALLERSAGAGIGFKINIPDGLPLALVDANQVELALFNLVVNARDAMPRGGTVTIDLSLTEITGAPDLAPGQYLLLVLTDTGEGMDEETLKRSTEPFFSTKELGKGTGLGLSMVQGLAVQLNGGLRLSSEVGRGTRAEMWLPVTDAVAPAPESDGSLTAEATVAKSTILIVDDDPLIAMSTVDMLEDLGHNVIEANSGEEALRILQDLTLVDLLITDYSMPKMTGAQLAKAARELKPDLPILLATGYAELPRDSGIELPRLAKPYRQDQLAAEISRLLKSAG